MSYAIYVSIHHYQYANIRYCYVYVTYIKYTYVWLVYKEGAARYEHFLGSGFIPLIITPTLLIAIKPKKF